MPRVTAPTARPTQEIADALDLPPGVFLLADGRIIARDADVERAFTAAVRRVKPFVQGHAAHWADGDRDLAADLAQEAWIKLWELDPLRFDPNHRGDQAYIRSVLESRIRDAARKELTQRGGNETANLHVRAKS